MSRNVSYLTTLNDPVVLASRILSRRWVFAILRVLENQPQRFSRIQQRIPGISTRSLGQVLLTLEEQGLVKRRIDSTRPPRVTYSLNEDPLLQEIVRMVEQWGKELLEKSAANPQASTPVESPPPNRPAEKSTSRRRPPARQ